MSITRSLTRPVTSSLTRSITKAQRRGGVPAEQFLVTDNGGEPFQVDDESETPEDFLVRAE